MSTPSDSESFLCSERILADSPGCTGISRKATISFSSAETFHATPPVHRVSVPRVDFSFSFPFVLPPKARQEGRQTDTRGLWSAVLLPSWQCNRGHRRRRIVGNNNNKRVIIIILIPVNPFIGYNWHLCNGTSSWGAFCSSSANALVCACPPGSMCGIWFCGTCDDKWEGDGGSDEINKKWRSKRSASKEWKINMKELWPSLVQVAVPPWKG